MTFSKTFLNLTHLIFFWLPLAASGNPCTVISGATIHPVAGPVIPRGVVVLAGKDIAYVGPETVFPMSSCEVLRADGRHIYPGLINGLTELGIQELGSLVPAGDDTGEVTHPVNAQVLVTDAINTDSRNIPIAQKYGITLALTAPSEVTPISGRSALISLSGGQLDQIVVRSPVGMHFNLGESVKGNFGSRNQDPATRLAIAQRIRQTLMQAEQYRVRKANNPELAVDGNLEALLPVIEGKIPALFRAQKYDDIMTAIGIAEEFSLRMILVRGAEAWKARDELARRKIPVLLGPVTDMPTNAEKLGALYENPGLLHAAGVKFAIITGSSITAFKLSQHAAVAVSHNEAYGFDEAAALRSITLTPAEILGVSDLYGSLEIGKRADLVITDGPLFRPQTRVVHVFVAGSPISLRTWQEDLRDKYRGPLPRERSEISTPHLR